MARTKDEFLRSCSQLTKTGQLTGIGALFIDGNNQIVLDEGDRNADITPTDSALTQALIDSSSDELVDKQDTETAVLVKTKIKDYLNRALSAANPNYAAMKSTIESAIAGNAKINQVIENIATLYGYDDSTDAGYIRCALLAIPVLIE